MQTSQMKEKQILTVKAILNEEIIAMNHTSSLYVDDLWFKTYMGEEKRKSQIKTTNYPVEITALKIRWFISSHYGKKFLTSILNNENIEMYNIITLRIIIEYFYIKYKKYLFSKELPIFLAQIFFFYLTMWSNEKLFGVEQDHNKSMAIHFIIYISLFAQFII